ncbi:MAG: DNA polymerase III subunit delta' [Clostridia bacterium]|nr:DNA polymerase III subunit delta' [Clostridia bacterium]
MPEIKARPFLLEQLMRPVNTGRIVHAMIFSGLAGTGRTEAAEYVARALNCTGTGVKPCGVCASCRRFLDGKAPELIRLEPENENKKPAKYIKIEQVRALLRETALHPLSGYKCVIIKPADSMTEEAQNALLKTLEEPPEYAVFFLITEKDRALLQTIRSRCVLYRFAPISVDEIKLGLEKAGYYGEEAEIAASYSGGSMGKALEFCGDKEFFTLYTKLAEAFELLARTGSISLAGPQLADMEGRKQLCLDILEISASELMRGAIKTRLAAALKSCRIDGAELMQALTECRKRLESNVMFRYAADMLLFDIVKH